MSFKDRLIDNPKDVLKRAASMWLAYASALFMALELGHQQLVDLLPILKPTLDDVAFGWLSFVCTVLIPVARVTRQTKRVMDQTLEAGK